MIDLNKIAQNPFHPIEIDLETWIEGTERHIAKLEASNPGGIYDDEIVASKANLDVLKDLVSARDSEQTEQQGSTILMNASVSNFIKFVRIREGLIKSTFEGDDTPEYEEFFPHGLTEYDHANLGNVHTLMDRMVNKATKYETQLGTPFKTACIAKRTAFEAARAAQLTNIGEASAFVSLVAEAVLKMSIQLTKNLLTISLNNIGVDGIADVYFDQHFFQRPEASGIYEGTNSANQTKTVRSQGWNAERIIKVTNLGTADFLILFCPDSGIPATGGQTITPGQTLETTAAALGYGAAAHYLNITAGDAGATWKVQVLTGG